MSVTVIIATHNRPDTLAAAIAALQLQTIKDWRAIVIGDCCDERTGATVAAADDPRITYINVPIRSGEQSGPNSVGMRLAETPFLAFLNHDDIWLPDHLEIALGGLARNEGADLFAGRAAFSFRTIDDGVRGRRPLFHDYNPLNRSLMNVFNAPLYLFEPASAWVFRKSLAQKVGDWSASHTIYRTPLEDWLLRAARAGTRLALDERISTLKITTHTQSPEGAKHYEWGADDQNFMLDAIRSSSPEAVRAFVNADFATAAAQDIKPRATDRRYQAPLAGWLEDRLLTPATAEVFIRTGWDANDVICQHIKTAPGALIGAAIKRRTGDEGVKRPSIDALMQAIQRG